MNGPTDTPEPPESGAHTDFRDAETYSDYLRLDTLLACQQPKSDHHDEMMFVIIHQATELWMKLILHEVTAATACVAADDLDPGAEDARAHLAHRSAADTVVGRIVDLDPERVSRLPR